jgi:hypothetical protein
VQSLYGPLKSPARASRSRCQQHRKRESWHYVTGCGATGDEERLKLARLVNLSLFVADRPTNAADTIPNMGEYTRELDHYCLVDQCGRMFDSCGDLFRALV